MADSALESFSRQLNDLVAALGGVREAWEQANSESLAERLKQALYERDEAVRHEGMFRRALFTYLQERDGPAGRGAPTPETLDWIRRLVEG